MTDDKLEHMCKLSSITIMSVHSKNAREGWMEHIASADETTLFNEFTVLSILAETCAELMKRAGIKPRFNVTAGS